MICLLYLINILHYINHFLTDLSPKNVIPSLALRLLHKRPPALIIYSFPSVKYLLCNIINFSFFAELIIFSGIILFGYKGGFKGILLLFSISLKSFSILFTSDI